MVAARVLQGAGGAMMAPLGRLILLRTVERRHLVSAFIGPMLGPPLGGFFVSYLDWRWIFYINVPIGIAGFLLVRRFIPEIPSESAPARFDLRGFLLCGTALGCLLFGLEMVSQQNGIGQASWLLAIGGSAGLGYLWHARHHPAPLLDLSLLRIASFRLSVIGGALMRITQGAQPFLLPLLFQIGFGMSAAHSGRLILATALGALLMRSITPQLLRRFGYRNSLIGNGVLASLGYMVCAFFRPDWPPAVMFGLLLCCGAFMSFQFAAYNTIAYENVPAARMSRASSLYTTLQQLMLSVGVCAGAMILNLAMLSGGHATPRQSDFSLAFCVVSLISLSATWWNVRFDKDAGQEMSGHRA